MSGSCFCGADDLFEHWGRKPALVISMFATAVALTLGPNLERCSNTEPRCIKEGVYVQYYAICFYLMALKNMFFKNVLGCLYDNGG